MTCNPMLNYIDFSVIEFAGGGGGGRGGPREALCGIS